MTGTHRPVEPAQFVAAMNHFVSGVGVVTSRDEGRPVGATVAAIAPIASDPPTVMMSMEAGSSTAAVIARSGVVTINVLDGDGAAVAGRFATRGADKFVDLETVDDELGNPLLPGRVAALSCRIVDAVPTGSHCEFRAVVVAADITGDAPLAYYRGAFAHLVTEADRSVLASVRASALSLRSDTAHTIDPEALGEEIGAARGAVLRALSTLRSEGLVERVDGTYRTAAVPDDVVDRAYEAKLAIELGVAQLVVERITDQDVTDLRAALSDILDAAPGGPDEGVEALVAALNAFEERLVGLAGGEPLVRAFRSLGLPGIDRRTITDAIFAKVPPTGGLEAVVDGLERRDLPAVVRALRDDRRTPAHVRSTAR